MRERECRWKHSPRILSWSLGRPCLAFSSRFFASPWCTSHRVSCLTWRWPLIFDSFFSVCIPGWIESSRQECRKSHSHSLISSNSRSRILPNALGESVQPALLSRCLNSQSGYYITVSLVIPTVYLSVWVSKLFVWFLDILCESPGPLVWLFDSVSAKITYLFACLFKHFVKVSRLSVWLPKDESMRASMIVNIVNKPRIYRIINFFYKVGIDLSNQNLSLFSI